MRFCPKCSLRIKANIENCPICKVELLSCAEDEVAATHSMQDELTANTDASADSIEPADPAVEETSMPITPASSPALPSQPEVGNTNLTQTVEQLGNQLNSIEKNLALITGKDDVIKKSIVDLESKLNKLEKQIVQLQAVPLDRFEALEKEVAQSVLQTTSAPSGEPESSETTPPTRGNIQTLKSLSGTMSPQSFTADEHSFSDEETSFASEDTDDFSSGFQTPDSTFDKNAVLRPQRPPKKRIPLLIPLLALAMIVVWLLFYYSRPKQPIQTEIVTQQVTPQPPVQPSTPSMEQTAITPDVTKDVPSETDEKTETLPEPVEKSPPVSQPPPPEAKKAPEKKPLFTVNVGSFKDKNLATALTTRLRDNGYTALMSQSEQNKFYRVRVGAFSTIEEARTFASNLQKKEKLPTFVTRLDQP